MIEVNQVSAEEAETASEMLRWTEGRAIALESGYTMAAVVRQAQGNSSRVIVAYVSSGDGDGHSCE
jgi:tryptophan synthase beta subunit